MTKRIFKHARGQASPRPRWLPLARAGWVAVSATALAIVLFNVRSSFEHYRSVCSAASEACSQRVPAQPTTEGLRQLREAGLSAGTYADLHVAIDKVLQLVWFSVGALIFFGAPTTGWHFWSRHSW